ncbi:MAG: peptidoglycan DD-metalloendopeptidase family protein [Lachnospiraceae bacterium]|nr:peptidoglycan DD-metalloendopeptidase family protein [Lachnospiraceae bacterium]
MEKEQFLLKYIKFVIIFPLIVIMIVGMRLSVYASVNEEIEQLEMERQQALEMIEGLKSSISEVQEDIDNLTIEKNDIQGYIKSLDGQINILTNEITAFERKIEEKIVDIEETRISLEQAKEACEQQYEAMKLRIRYMYENGKSNILEIFIGLESMAEMLKQATFMEAVYTYDRNMLDEYTAIKDEIARKENVLEAELNNLELMQAELRTQKEKIDNIVNRKKGELIEKNGEISDALVNRKDYEEELEQQEKLLNEIEEEIAKAANPDRYTGTISGFIWPCPDYNRISSYFGPRPQPVPGASTNHKGIDLTASYGTAILASASGMVTTATHSNSAGNYIVIAHGNGMSTVYMHCSLLLVSVGDNVEQGEMIAKVGSTGYSSGNHLHFGIIKNGTYVDPLEYVSD